jgi:hypothetical protein
VATYEERASAAKRRPSFDRMMTDARRGAFNVLLVGSIDRFGRSMAGTVNDALALDNAGVKIFSVREPWLDTGGPGGGSVPRRRGLHLNRRAQLIGGERSSMGERTELVLFRASAV